VADNIEEELLQLTRRTHEFGSLGCSSTELDQTSTFSNENERSDFCFKSPEDESSAIQNSMNLSYGL